MPNLPEYYPAPSGGGALTPATPTALGGIKVGAGLAVELDGLLSVALPTLTKETLTTSGTWTAPADGVVMLILVGGGGGGGGGQSTTSVSDGGGGGGGGGIRFARWVVTAGGQIVISLGAGGQAGAIARDGGAGTSSTATYGAETVEAGAGSGGQSNEFGGLGGTGDLPGAIGGVGGQSPASQYGMGGCGGWPNGGNGATVKAGVISGGDAGAPNPGGDGYAIIFFAARPVN